MDKIRYEEFKSICRMCMLDCDTNFNKDSALLNIFHKLTDIHFDTNAELPQKICFQCLDFINEIHSFSMKCKQTHFALTECLNNYKNKRLNEELETIEVTTDEEMENNYEISIEEHIDEFVKAELHNDCKINDSSNEELEIIEATTDVQMEIKYDITNEEHKIEFVKVEPDNDLETNDLLNKDVTKSANDLLPAASNYIQTENEVDSLNIINSNDLNNLDSESSGNIIFLRNNKKVIKTSKDKQNKFKIRIIGTYKKEHKHIIEYPTVPEINNMVQTRHYKCDQCEKAFTKSGNLTVHRRVHTGERPYKCDQCEKFFIQLNHLKDHKRVHTGERQYKCDQCEKSFTYLNVLKTHKRVHTGERPYKCDLCEKSFIQLVNLKDHKRVHTGERLYKCGQCEKSFTQSSHLIRHKRVHS